MEHCVSNVSLATTPFPNIPDSPVEHRTARHIDVGALVELKSSTTAALPVPVVLPSKSQDSGPQPGADVIVACVLTTVMIGFELPERLFALRFPISIHCHPFSVMFEVLELDGEQQTKPPRFVFFIYRLIIVTGNRR